MKRLIPIAAVFLFLTACSTAPSVYTPAEGGGYGYSEQQLEENRYRVSYSGNSATSRERVEDYLLYRASELTLQNGYDYFVMTARDTEPRTSYYGSGTPYAGWPPGYGFYGYGGGGFGVGLSTSTARPVTRYRAYADIVLYRGETPEKDSWAYDAREVMDQLGPELVRKGEN
ncbi:hypothetical protein ACFOW6_16955 [Fodinicurvata halophila]|uniref:Lipoprotein n=1 Tax=Fodinicurvata halophila TaxID=1419723 RepID=A0ABV8UPV3_9PROT